MSHPNIVYLHSHDTGRHVQPYGYAVPTPRIQAVAEAGVVFRQAFCQAPTCSPSRAALLTGQSAHRAGMIGLAHRGFTLADYSQHLCHTLNAAGYLTALAGFQHVAHEPFADLAAMGYQKHLNTHRHENAELRAAEFIAAKPQQPFFLDCGFFETHRREAPEGAFVEKRSTVGDPRYVRPPANLPDTPDTRKDYADFIAAAGVLDRKIGIVLDALGAAGLADNTLVIITTDHGLPFPGAKCNLTDAGTGVMLIVRGPGGFAGGRVIDAMVSHMDLFPTICDLAGIAKPAWLEGQSMLPLVGGKVTQLHEALFAEVTFHSAYEPQRSVRTSRWKYIKRFEDRNRVTLSNIDDGLSKSELATHGWADHERPGEALYDLEFDPTEMQNLAADPRHAGVLVEMRARLETWMKQTADPLLAGPVAPPTGARVTDAWLYSPTGREDVRPEHPLSDRGPTAHA